MREEVIAEVGMDDEHRVFVRPATGDFEHVHRAAMEVYWERATRRLSHPQPSRGWKPERWFQQIIAAVADEYGVRLKLTATTSWTDVPSGFRTVMQTVAEANDC